MSTLAEIIKRLKRKHKGCLVRDVRIDNGIIHYIVVNKDDSWVRKSCGDDV